MSKTAEAFSQNIDKRHIEATIHFAIQHIPQVDEATLTKFLELINATGNFGSISARQLRRKMKLLAKYVPNVCMYSLLMLAELLDIYWPTQTTCKKHDSTEKRPKNQVFVNHHTIYSR